MSGSALTPRETEIVMLDEAGGSIASIARDLGITRDYVSSTLNRYSYRHCWNNSDRFERMTRAGDRAYREALAATGKRYA